MLLFRALVLHSDEVLTFTQNEVTRSSTTLDSLSKQTSVHADTIGLPVKVMSAWLKQISHAARTYYDYLRFSVSVPAFCCVSSKILQIK